MLEQQKTEITHLLRAAKGRRTLDTFANETGISKFQLCRIMNGNYKNIPRLSTLKAIAEHSEIPGLFEKIMDIVNAAVPDPQIEEEIIFEGTPKAESEPKLPFDFAKHEKLCKAVILDALSSATFTWSTGSPHRRPGCLEFPIRISISNHPIRYWSFYFLAASGKEDMTAVRNFLGDLSLYHPFANEKISLVFTDMSLYYNFFSLLTPMTSQPIWNMNFSILLIDLDKIEVEDEEQISLHDSVSPKEFLAICRGKGDDFILSEIETYRSKRKQFC